MGGGGESRRYKLRFCDSHGRRGGASLIVVPFPIRAQTGDHPVLADSDTVQKGELRCGVRVRQRFTSAPLPSYVLEYSSTAGVVGLMGVWIVEESESGLLRVAESSQGDEREQGKESGSEWVR